MEKFLEILAKLDPDKTLISEEARKELCDLMESKEKAIKEEAYAKALNLVSAKLDTKDVESKKLLEEEITKLNEAHGKELADLDTSHANLLQKLFDALDNAHAEKLETLTDSIDEDHAKKLTQVAEAIDEDHSKKLQKLQTIYENAQVSEKIVDGVSDYLDVYLEKVVPQPQLVNEAKLERLDNFYNSVREMALVNDDYVQTEIKEAVLDAKQQLEKKDKEIDNLMLEKVELSKKIKRNEAETLLDDKCKDRSPKATAYLKTFFCESTKEEIEEKFDEALAAFDKDEAATRQKLVVEAESKKKVHAPAALIVEAKNEEQRTITESDEEDLESHQINSYVDLLKRSNK